MTSRLRFEETC